MATKISYDSLDWFGEAKCKGKSETFFGQIGEATRIRREREATAIAICQSCDAIYKCRQFARENSELGVWGGETEDQRFAAGFLKDPNVSRRNKAKIRRLAIKQASNDTTV